MAQSSVEVGRPTLQVRGRAPAAGSFVGAKIVFEDAAGEEGVIWIPETPIPTDGTLTEVQAGEGLPKGAVIKEGEVFLIQATSTPLQRGACAVRLIAGDHTITQGYLHQGRWSVDMLNPEVLGPAGGEGNIRTVTGTDQAANTEVSEAVPADAVWDLLSFSVVLVTDANAANRSIDLVIDDGTTENKRESVIATGTSQVASVTRTHLWAPFGINRASDNVTVDGIDLGTHWEMRSPGLLPEGYRVRTNTRSIQATDNYAAPIFQVREWLLI